MRLDDQLDRALEDALRARHALPEVLRTMRDSMPGQPGAHVYDAVVVGGGRTLVWCWDHEREVRLCHKANEPCMGESVTIADQTGEAAVEDDEVFADHKATQKDIAALAHHADRLVRRFANYKKRAATEKERRDTERANEPGCELHGKAGKWVLAFVLSSTVAGTLDEPLRLCRDCYERVRTTGERPPDSDVQYHAKTDKWPRRHAGAA